MCFEVDLNRYQHSPREWIKLDFVPKDFVEEFTRELLFKMLVQNPKYLVEFLGYTIYSINEEKTDIL